MKNISHKKITHRVAKARAGVCMAKSTFKTLCDKGSPKGDVFEAAKIAGIMAAKNTGSLVPMCHPLAIEAVAMQFQLDQKQSTVFVTAEVSCHGRTGVEMEALCAVSAAALTIYDMMKWKDKSMEIREIQLLEKSGGKSGRYQRK